MLSYKILVGILKVQKGTHRCIKKTAHFKPISLRIFGVI